MGILTTQFPELPSTITQEGRSVVFYKHNDNYIILDNATFDGHYINNIGNAYIYKVGQTSWNKYFLSSTNLSEKTIIYSSFDIVDNGKILSVGQPLSEMRSNMTSYSTVGLYSSSTFLTALNDTKLVLSIVFVLAIACIGFRKAFGWLRGTIKGA